MRRLHFFLVASAVTVAAAPAVAFAADAPVASASPGACQLGNGIEHVIELTFDNVHFFRDNPNVPSDLELMPHLMNFLKDNGALLSNMHTPLIAHTANDSLTTYTGLYGDRAGMPISNSYRTFNPDGTSDPAGSFVYWTDPVFDTLAAPTAGHDTNPSMVYSAHVPASGTTPNTVTPAPWVPFTRAGCAVGDVSTANMVLENAGFDIPKVFGPSSPEAAQLAADPNSFKNNETADYIGLAVHCAQSDAFCASATGMRGNETTVSPTATADVLADEPGGYTGFQALYGHRYISPQVGGGVPNVSHNGYAVTNAAGNLVDLFGNELDGGFTSPPRPGFPGFGPIVASQTLAYVADLQEAGVPVTYGYIGDIHERKAGQSACSTTTAIATGYATGPGDACSIATARAYDQAFATFFDRLAASGITAANTLFIVTADENDHFDGANIGRAVQPTPATCDGVNVPCGYSAGQIGELNTSLNGLVATQKGNTTPFVVEPQGAVVYVNGKPAGTDPAARQLERDVASVTASNPFTGNTNETIANYLAGPAEQQILHLVNADPARTPTFTLFPKPDYYFGTNVRCPTDAAACVSLAPRFAWNHGYYSPDIAITWSGFVGPGIGHVGVDGPAPAEGPAVLDPNATGTVPRFSKDGTWADLTDVRPTLLALTGLRDDYATDGRVLAEIMSNPGRALRGEGYTQLARCYKQINASVGQFATDTLIADTAALASGSATNDERFTRTQSALSALGAKRDALATQIKTALSAAAFDGARIRGERLNESCHNLLEKARELRSGDD
jgi:hypothetical protein